MSPVLQTLHHLLSSHPGSGSTIRSLGDRALSLLFQKKGDISYHTAQSPRGQPNLLQPTMGTAFHKVTNPAGLGRHHQMLRRALCGPTFAKQTHPSPLTLPRLVSKMEESVKRVERNPGLSIPLVSRLPRSTALRGWGNSCAEPAQVCVGEGHMIEKIKLKHKIVSLSLNIITRDMVWVGRNGDKLAPNGKLSHLRA